jgi:hypothetical protein
MRIPYPIFLIYFLIICDAAHHTAISHRARLSPSPWALASSSCGAVFTSWVEPPDAAVWAAHLARLSVFAAHMHDVMTPLLEIARGLLPVGAGADPINFEELGGDGGDRPDSHLRGVDINPADLQGGEFQARAERAVMGDFAPNPPSATGES